jgi:hypothetical protein
MRMRTKETTKPRGSFALEDTLWNFVVAQMASTGLTKNGVLRKAILSLKRAVEDGIVPLPSARPLPENRAIAETPPDNISGAAQHGVRISQSVTDKLARMRLLNGVLRSEERPDDLISEYRALQEEMVHTFIPLIDTLVRAGLITVNVDLEDVDGLRKFTTVFGDPAFVFENGNIWIDSKHSGGMLMKQEDMKT